MLFSFEVQGSPDMIQMSLFRLGDIGPCQWNTNDSADFRASCAPQKDGRKTRHPASCFFTEQTYAEKESL